MGHSGFTSELHSSTASPFSTRTMPISVMRWRVALPPVVSKSTNTNSCGSPAASEASAASIEREQRVVQIGTPIAEHPPATPIAAHGIQIECRGENGLADPVRFGHLLAGVRGDER